MSSSIWRQTGGIWPLSVPTSLTWYDIGAIAYIMNLSDIRTVVEIGVDQGGLSAFLLSYARFNTQPNAYLGLDINPQLLSERVAENSRAYDIIKRDVWRAETVQEVAQFLHDHAAPALILCDGGDKPKELHLYAPLLRYGDVLLGHDYHNEYGDDALDTMPATVQQVRRDWLDDTLLCMFVRREE